MVARVFFGLQTFGLFSLQESSQPNSSVFVLSDRSIFSQSVICKNIGLILMDIDYFYILTFCSVSDFHFIFFFFLTRKHLLEEEQQGGRPLV